MAARKQREADPGTQLRELEASLSQGLARGYVLRGEERYFHERGIEKIRERAVADDYEVCFHDAQRGNPDFKLGRLLDDLGGGGLFATRRLVVLRHPGDHLKKSGAKDSELTRALRSFIEGPDDCGTVVISDSALRADHAVSKAVKTSGGRLLGLRKLWDSPPPWSPDPRKVELVLWVGERAREMGLRLRPDQAVYVAAATGNDLFALEDQLERLKAAPEHELAQVVGWNSTATPWGVADYVVAGDAPRALEGIETLFKGGFQEKSGKRLVDVVALATMLSSSVLRSVRQGLLLADLLRTSGSEASAVQAAGIKGPPAAVQGTVARAKRRTPGEWHGMLEDASNLERKAKTGGRVDANEFARFALAWAVADAGRRR